MTRSTRHPRTWRLARTSETAPEAASVLARSKSFGAAVANVGQATLLVMRDEESLSSFVVTPRHANAARLADDVANAVGARAEPVPPDPGTGDSVPPDLTDARVVGVVVARPSEMAARDIQAGADPNEVARLLARSMRPGSWMAVSCRGYRRAEARRVRRWYQHRMTGLTTHHTNESEAVVCTLYAGGESADEVRSLLTSVVATLPGFDIDVKVKIVSSTILATAGFSAASLAAWGGLGVYQHDWPIAVAASLPLAGIAIGVSHGWLPTGASRLENRLDRGAIPSPSTRAFPPRRPRKESTNSKTGKTVDARAGDYPLAPTSFFVSPAVVVGVASPHTGTGSGAAVGAVREPSAPLLGDIGPVVGTAGASHRPVHISTDDAPYGVGLLGVPGSGKSVAVGSLFAWNCLERTRPSGKPGRPGRDNTLVVFENKGEGAVNYQKWVAATGDQSMLIEVADPSTPAVDLFSAPGPAEQRAAFFVNAMVYAMGEQSIAYQSSMTLNAVLSAALLITPGIAADAELPTDLSPVAYAHILLTGWGDEDGQKLAMAFVAHAKKMDADDPQRAEHVGAVRGLAPLYGGKVTPAQRRQLCSAPMSKTKMLAKVEHWFAPARPKVSWADILDKHWAVVINSGVTTAGQILDDDIGHDLSSMLMYGLRDAIMRTCSGWQAAGRSVSVFADELALLAGSSPEVITWLRNQGRSYGVRPVLATQYPDQLDPAVRKALMSFATVFWFTQTDPQTVADAAADLSVDGGTWTGADVANLEPYHALLRASVGKRRQPAVPVAMGFWDDRRAEFAADQGYGPGPGAQPKDASQHLTGGR